MFEKSVSFSSPIVRKDHFEIDSTRFPFNNRDLLSEDMKFIISTPVLCDLVLLVGDNREPVYALKSILAVRSRTFFQMIAAHHKTPKIGGRYRLTRFLRKLKPRPTCLCSRMSVDGDAPDGKINLVIEDFEPSVIRHLVVYAHCGEVTITPDNVIGLMNAAQAFDFQGLYKKCTEVAAILSNSPGCVIDLVNSAMKYVHFKNTRIIVQKALNFINQQPDYYKQFLGEKRPMQTCNRNLHSSIEIQPPNEKTYHLDNLTLSPISPIRGILKKTDNDSGYYDEHSENFETYVTRL